MKHLTPAECVFPNPVSSFLFSLRFELKKYTNMIFFATILGRSEKQFRLMLAFWQSVLVQAFFRLFFFFSLAANGKKLGTLVPNQTLFSRLFVVLAFFLSFARPPFLFLLLTFILALEADEDACISIRLKLLTKTMNYTKGTLRFPLMALRRV